MLILSRVGYGAGSNPLAGLLIAPCDGHRLTYPKHVVTALEMPGKAKQTVKKKNRGQSQSNLMLKKIRAIIVAVRF